MQGTNQPFVPMSPQQPAAPPVPETSTSRFIRSKYPIVILALVVYILFAFGLEFLVGSAVFSSLIVWEIVEFFLTTFVIKQPAQQGGLVNILFMFGGISSEQTQIILKVLGLVNKIIRDIAIFMFTFVMLHLSWSFLVLGESVTEILDKDFSNLLKNDEL
jgi:calcium signal-modulating cyclophilin ligand